MELRLRLFVPPFPSFLRLYPLRGTLADRYPSAP